MAVRRPSCRKGCNWCNYPHGRCQREKFCFCCDGSALLHLLRDSSDRLYDKHCAKFDDPIPSRWSSREIDEIDKASRGFKKSHRTLMTVLKRYDRQFQKEKKEVIEKWLNLRNQQMAIAEIAKALRSKQPREALKSLRTESARTKTSL